MKIAPWLTAALALSIVTPAVADPGTGGASGPGAHRKEIRARMLREKAGLPEEKAKKVEAILERFAPERERLRHELRAAHEKLQALVAGNGDDQAAYRTALEHLKAQRKAMIDLMDRAFAEVSRELTPKEQAKLFVVMAQRMGGFGGRGHGRWHRGHGHDDDDDDD